MIHVPKIVIGRPVEVILRRGAYCFLTKDERTRAKLLLEEFKARVKKYEQEVNGIGFLVDKIDKDMRQQWIKANLPQQVLKESYHAWVGFAYMHAPYMVMFLVEAGEIIKPYVKLFKERIKQS